MEFKLAKCARCDKLFNKIKSDVCDTCQPDEDADFSRIHEAISRARGMSAQQVAEEADVAIECVFRMLREGRIDHVENEDAVTCGRCGAPAISHTKKLCTQCLMELDRECASAMMEMRQRIRSKEESDMHDVQAAVSSKRASKKPRRERTPDPTPKRKPAPTQRMALQEHLRKKSK